MKKLISLVLVLFLAAALAPASLAAGLGIRDGVEYIDADGEMQFCEDYTLVTENDTEWTGWMVAEGEVYIDARVEAVGEVHLILADDAILTIRGGVHVPTESSFTVYGQNAGTGVLNAAFDQEDYEFMFSILDIYGAAGIGSNSGDNTDETNGEITINGGLIFATGFNAPGIGDSEGKYCGGVITINGGYVEAKGDDFLSPGIGIGWTPGTEEETSSIIINGGIVDAWGDVGIGDMTYQGGMKIFINGGIVTSTGIGGRSNSQIYGCPTTITGGVVTVEAPAGEDGSTLGVTPTRNYPNTLTITGGQVTANVPVGSAETVIELGWTDAEDFIQAPGYSGSITLTKDFRVDGSDETFSAGEVADNSVLAGKTLVPDAEFRCITFLNWDGSELSSQSVAMGETPVYNGPVPTRPSTAACDYTFIGWEPELAPVTDDAEYTAVFEESINGILGDVNFSGEVDSYDALLILRCALQLIELPDEALPFADVNGDGMIDSYDALMTLRIALNLI